MMMNDIQGLMQRVTTGTVDPSNVSSAASDQVSNMSHEQLSQHLQTAAQSADTNGFGDVAQDLRDLLAQHGSNPQDLKQQAISMISSNPEILQHFAPDFAKGILSRL